METRLLAIEDELGEIKKCLGDLVQVLEKILQSAESDHARE